MDNTNVLKELFGSETRVALLQELMVKETKDSALGFSRRVGRSYHPVTRELERFVRTGLVHKQRRGAAAVYGWRSTNRVCRVLRELLTQSFQPGRAEADVDAALSTLMEHGAPIRRSKVARRLPLEHALAVAARQSRQDGTVLRVLPLMLVRLHGRLDQEKLWQECHRLDVEQTMGYLLDLAGRVTASKQLQEWAADYRDGRRHLIHYFFAPRNRYEEELARRHTPPLARRWGFYLNVPESDFKDLLVKFK